MSISHPAAILWTYSTAFLLAGLISFGFVGLILWRFSSELMDVPNARSSHSRPTPRGGGLGFVLSFVLSSLLVAVVLPKTLPLGEAIQICSVILPLAWIGYLDDRYSLSAKARYAVQLISAGLAVYYFGPFSQFSWTGFSPWMTLVAFSLLMIGFTAVINFMNFMDGLDGLVAGVGVIQFTFIAFYLNQPIWGLLAAALVGFLWWNWSPAKIFMGDVGSTVLGAALALALLNAYGIDLPALAIALPIVGDAVYTLVRRFLKGENIFQAHRFHLYQRLQQSGWGHRQVAFTYMALTGAIALLVSVFHGVGAIASIILVFFFIVLCEAYLYRRLAGVSE